MQSSNNEQTPAFTYGLLLDWIPVDNINWFRLCRNPNAIPLLEANPQHIVYSTLSENPNAIHILEQNPDKIDWDFISSNPSAGHLFDQSLLFDNLNICRLIHNPSAFHLINENRELIPNLWDIAGNTCNEAIDLLEIMIEDYFEYDQEMRKPQSKRYLKHICTMKKCYHHSHYFGGLYELDWQLLSANPSAVRILEKYPEQIDWTGICKNPNAIHIIEANLEQADWTELSANPNAIHLIEANMDNVDWQTLCYNPNAIHIIEKNMHMVDWTVLSLNPSAIGILEATPQHVNWDNLWNNTAIFANNAGLK